MLAFDSAPVELGSAFYSCRLSTNPYGEDMNAKLARLPRSFVTPLLFLALVAGFRVSAATPPAVGDNAPNFTLQTLDSKSVELRQITATQAVVLVVLRGWPGYQCPICTRQVNEFTREAGEFAKLNARVVMVYPSPAEKLKEHAQEFLQNKEWPKEFVFVTDPDYRFTDAYGLRWNAPKETAYPSTFVIGKDNKVRFSQVSKTHGGRAKVTDVLKTLSKARR
jgi:peroxiredoxin